MKKIKSLLMGIEYTIGDIMVPVALICGAIGAVISYGICNCSLKESIRAFIIVGMLITTVGFMTDLVIIALYRHITQMFNIRILKYEKYQFTQGKSKEACIEIVIKGIISSISMSMISNLV